MSVYKAPVRDMEFIFQDVLNVQNLEIPGYRDLDNEFLKRYSKKTQKKV